MSGRNLGVTSSALSCSRSTGSTPRKFVERMQLENISATGIFDGEIPLCSTSTATAGSRAGTLTSRGGGNISYVGALTYKDLSPMANVAFERSVRSTTRRWTSPWTAR